MDELLAFDPHGDEAVDTIDPGAVYDVAIVGGGPAGVSCALWLKQLGFAPVLVDRQRRCGGLQRCNPYGNSWIASSFGVNGQQVADALHANMLAHRVALCLGMDCVGADLVSPGVSLRLADGRVLRARRLVLAGGVAPRTGGLARRAGLVIGPGTPVARAELAGARVAILGGGDNAFENWHFAMARGAACATIFARHVRARASLVAGVPPQCVRVGPCEVDAKGLKVNGEAFDQVLVLYGYEASPGALLGLSPALRPDGFVWTDAEARTSLPGVYAIGELAQRAHPCCATAMADGVVAAKAIQRELEAMAPARWWGAARRVFKAGLDASRPRAQSGSPT